MDVLANFDNEIVWTCGCDNAFQCVDYTYAIELKEEITKLRAELRLAQDIIGDLQRHEPVCLGESRNARPR